MSGSSDNDSQERFALGFLFILIALIISTAVGTVVVKRLGAASANKAAPAPTTALANNAPAAPAADTAAAAATAADAASVRVDNGVVKFYFASGKADLAAGGADALAEAAKAAKEGKKLGISGFHDATGDLATNQELAKQRAFAVRDALVALGVDAAQVELVKPAATAGDGANAEARRVEVTVQ